MIVFRADGSTEIGLGHITRSLALADMLRSEFEISVAIKAPGPEVVKLILPVTKNIIPIKSTSWVDDARELASHITHDDIVVLDGYGFDMAYQQVIKQKAKKLVVIDDLHKGHYTADVIINQSSSVTRESYLCETYTKVFTGMDYALLRSPFLEAALQQRKIERADTWLISMGGADITNITTKAVKAVMLGNKPKAIHVIVGSVNPHKKEIARFIYEYGKGILHYHEGLTAGDMCALMSQCHIALCPASSLSIEACAVGIGLGVGITATNQQGILHTLEKSKTILNFGDLNALSVEEMALKLQQLANVDIINIQVMNQRKLIDGRSPERLRNIFRNL